jgi:hypothetical protein
VTEAYDVGLPAFERAVDAFVQQLGPDDIALFYFSGHGMEIDGENFLIPVDFTGVDEVDVKHKSYSATRIHEKLEARSRIRLVVLDACRDNPYKTTRSGRGGLAEMSAQGSLIAYATGPGKTASDGPRRSNGLFTEKLLETLKQPGLSATDVFRQVRAKVSNETGGKQFPWLWDGLIGDFYFRPGDAAARPAPLVVPAPEASRPAPPAPSDAPTASSRRARLGISIDPELSKRINALFPELRAAGFEPGIFVSKAPGASALAQITSADYRVAVKTETKGVLRGAVPGSPGEGSSCTVDAHVALDLGSGSQITEWTTTAKGSSFSNDGCDIAKDKAVRSAITETVQAIRKGQR